MLWELREADQVRAGLIGRCLYILLSGQGRHSETPVLKEEEPLEHSQSILTEVEAIKLCHCETVLVHGE